MNNFLFIVYNIVQGKEYECNTHKVKFKVDNEGMWSNNTPPCLSTLAKIPIYIFQIIEDY